MNRPVPDQKRRRSALGALLIVALLLLAGCAAGGPLTTQTLSYQVTLTLDERRVGEHPAMITIERREGKQPGPIESVSIVPMMRQHGMVSPEVIAQPLPDGRYQADGLLFSMDGDWQIEVYIDRSDAREIAVFEIRVWP
ncbi:FixH family protein [Roseiflexus sp.]|uniref:FixH family protein n=1 Tax=Roseiflexus sp. TaxID=2562120 RepID=UPI00398AA81D